MKSARHYPAGGNVTFAANVLRTSNPTQSFHSTSVATQTTVQVRFKNMESSPTHLVHKEEHFKPCSRLQHYPHTQARKHVPSPASSSAEAAVVAGTVGYELGAGLGLPLRTSRLTPCSLITDVTTTSWRPDVSTDVYLKPLNEQKSKQTPWPLVRKRTIPTEPPPVVDEI
jgi:hypothetical protein